MEALSPSVQAFGWATQTANNPFGFMSCPGAARARQSYVLPCPRVCKYKKSNNCLLLSLDRRTTFLGSFQAPQISLLTGGGGNGEEGEL